MDYWNKETLSAIDSMLNPKSVAIIGASENKSYGGRFMAKALSSKGALTVYPVNPNRNEIQGQKAYKSVLDLPEVPDAAAILVPWNFFLQAESLCTLGGFKHVQTLWRHGL